MKKILISLLFCGLSSIAINAQGKGNIEFSLNAGFNSSTVTNEDGRFNYHSGFNVGIGADFYFNERWSIKAKAIYDRKGFDDVILSNLDTGLVFSTNFEMDYITVPVMANWHFGRTKNWYLNFGPYVGFLMSAKESRYGTDVKDGLNTTDAGLALGIGVKIPVSDKLKIFIEYDGQSGFSDIFKSDYDYNTYISRSALNVGINFLLK